MKTNNTDTAIITSPEIGGKAKGLLLLRKNQLSTPDFFVFDYGWLSKAVTANDGIRGFFVDWWKAQYLSKNELWSVRSSTADEDGQSKSFAGQFTTKLNVTFEEIPEAIQEVLNSYQTVTDYAGKSNKYGVILQKMLHPEFSGVFFSRDPIEGYSEEPVLSIIPGLGDKLVSGELDGCYLSFENQTPQFKSTDELIEGETIKNEQRSPISCSVNDIEKAIQPHLQKMLDEAHKLENTLGLPLDFEFAIEKGQFYWLQVRPITTRTLKPDVLVWDNTSIEANYPDTTLPLSISFIRKTFFRAYAGGGRSIHFSEKVLTQNEALLGNMCGEIEGALYYNVTAWQSLIFQMPFGSNLAPKLPKLWGMEPVKFHVPKTHHSRIQKLRILFSLLGKILNGSKLEKTYLNIYASTEKSFEAFDLNTASLEELKDIYQRIESELGDNWLAPVLNGFRTMLVFTLLKRKIKKSQIHSSHPNFINDILFSDGDVISVQLVREFQSILHDIAKDSELRAIFENTSDQQVLSQIAIASPEFYNRIHSYIQHYGNRTDQGELKMETISYKQNPTLFIRYIQTNLQGFVARNKQENAFDYKSILKQNYPINFIQRWIFQSLIKRTSKRMRARENYRFMRTDTFAMIRTIFLQMGEILAKQKAIGEPRDVLFLELDELMDSSIQAKYKAIIQKRKSEYERYENALRPNRYMEADGNLFPIEVEASSGENGELKGIGCCSGIVTAKVMVIDAETNLSQNMSEFILIANYFEPGWINLFYQAKGIISERGNLLSHTSIICRELNVPSIVGAKGLMKQVKSGDLITMDGARGILKIISDENI